MPKQGANAVEAWAQGYVEREQSAVRGGRRSRTRGEIQLDVKAAFPTLTLLQVLYWVWWIWIQLRK